MSLRDVHRADALASSRPFEEAARFHVWHRRLGFSDAVDDAVVEALARGRGFAVSGVPGSGKSSVLAAAAFGTDGMAPARLVLRLSVAGAHLQDHGRDPRYLAGRLLREMATSFRRTAAEALRDQAASRGTVQGRRAITQITALQGTIGKELTSRAEDLSFERTPDELIDAVERGARSLTEGGARPVIVLDDADGLLRDPRQGGHDEAERVSGFLADSLAPLLRGLPIPALLAIQPHYVELSGFDALRPVLDGVGEAPRLADATAAGVQLLIDEILRTAGIDPAAVFDDEARSLLVDNRYSLRPTTFRALMATSDRALKQARTAGHDLITADDVAYALSQA